MQWSSTAWWALVLASWLINAHSLRQKPSTKLEALEVGRESEARRLRLYHEIMPSDSFICERQATSLLSKTSPFMVRICDDVVIGMRPLLDVIEHLSCYNRQHEQYQAAVLYVQSPVVPTYGNRWSFMVWPLFRLALYIVSHGVRCCKSNDGTNRRTIIS